MSFRPIHRAGATATLGFLVALGCEDYDCHDLANCPTETVDAGATSTCSGPECVPTSGSVTSSEVNTGEDSTSSMSMPPSYGDSSSSDVINSDVTSEGTPSCPNGPEGSCECSAGDKRSCALGGAKGACAEGTQICTEDGVFGECDVLASSDDCSVKGNDADCDGTPNSGCPCVDGDTQPCGPDTDVGQCEFGVSRCEDSVYGACEGAVERAPRRCDSTQDNDCDGVPDNTLDDTCKCVPGDTQQCNRHPGFDGVGPCRAGNQTCELSEDGTRSDWGPCTGDVAPEASDSCIEGDNSDCVGTPNTSCVCVAGEVQSCSDRYGSKGICASVDLTCQEDGTWPGTASCMAEAEPEDCRNALDDNCDGTPNDATSCPCNQVPSPCVHGTCSSGAGSAFSCDCTGTGYEGTLCDKPIAQVIAGPTGATSCYVVGVSNGGTSVAANCDLGEVRPKAYFWTSGAWIEARIPVGYDGVYVSSLTADGTVAVGYVWRDGLAPDYACRWAGLTTTATLLNSAEFKSTWQVSANGNAIIGGDPGGNTHVWVGSGSSAPLAYGNLNGNSPVLSGDGTKLFTLNIETATESAGFRIWTSPQSSTVVSRLYQVVPVAVSSDGSAMIGKFGFGYSGPSGFYKYRNSTTDILNSVTDCLPLNISSDGRYVLGKCPSGLTRWADATPSTVQSLVASTGSTVTLRTDVNGVMSYDAKYVALPSSGTGIVVAHLPSP